MKKTFIFFAKIIIFLIGAVAIERFCHKQTRGFSILKISSYSPLADREEIYSFTQEEKKSLDAMLDQPFFFLNSGGQCYAFISQDEKIIIKFFKHHHIRLWQWLNDIYLPNFLEPFRKKLLQAKRHHSPEFLESCKIAYHDFKDRTGLLYLHIHRTGYFKKRVKIVDKLGITHLIDLDATDFALQKKAELSHETFKKLIREQNFPTARKCLNSLVSLIIERCQKGIKDRDPNIRRNIGFLDTTAIEIDLGSFTKEDQLKNPDHYKIEIYDKTKKFHRWLSKQDKDLAIYLTEQLQSESSM